MDHRESEDVSPPSGCSLAIGNCEINMRDSHELWHTGHPSLASQRNIAAGRLYFRRRRGLATLQIADATGDMPPSNPAVFYISDLPYIVVHVLAAIGW